MRREIEAFMEDFSMYSCILFTDITAMGGSIPHYVRFTHVTGVCDAPIGLVDEMEAFQDAYTDCYTVSHHSEITI